MRESLVPALVRGYASHHAGLLPAWKGLIESLFQRCAHTLSPRLSLPFCESCRACFPPCCTHAASS